jgi:hypothetical protein
MIKKTGLAFALIITASGCATTSSGGYYWGSYSNSYYEWLKAPSPETLAERKASLEDIVNTSKEKGLRVPPGIQAELGKIYAEEQNSEMASSMLRAEMETYPESTVFLQRLLEQSEGGQ